MKTKQLKQLLTMTQQGLLKSLPHMLTKYGYNPVVTSYAVGAPSPLPYQPTLVAHLDTVNENRTVGISFVKVKGKSTYVPSKKVNFKVELEDILETENYIMLSPEANPDLQCLGADDRVGVWTIFEILRRGHRPNVLFLTDEEIGCVGSNALTRDRRNLFDFLNKSSYLIQVDRGVHEGSWNEMVFYDHDDQSIPEVFNAMEKYWVLADGSYTDVAVLGPHFNKPIVNFSASYKNEHTRSEFILKSALSSNTDNLDTFLKELNGMEGKETWTYTEVYDSYPGYGNYYGYEDIKYFKSSQDEVDPQEDTYNKYVVLHYLTLMFPDATTQEKDEWFENNVGCYTEQTDRDIATDSLELIFYEGGYEKDIKNFTL